MNELPINSPLQAARGLADRIAATTAVFDPQIRLRIMNPPIENQKSQIANPPTRCVHTFQYEEQGHQLMASDWAGLIPGQRYQVEVSQDLKNWSFVASELLWEDPDPTSYLRVVREIAPAPSQEYIRLGML